METNMPQLTVVRNGVTKANPKKRRKRRNPVAKATATANPRRRRRRNASVTRRNPVAAKATANPRRKRRRRNPVITKANPRRRKVGRRRNGIFGDTKADAKNVLSLLGGLVGTKIVGGIAAPYVASLLAYIGMSRFAQPVTDAAVAVFAVAPVAGMVGGNESRKLARLGGIAVAGLDLLSMVLPSGFSYNPFAVNTTPIVLQGGGIDSGTAKQIAAAAAAEVAAGGNPNNVASKVGMIYDALEAQSWNVGNSPSGVPLI